MAEWRGPFTLLAPRQLVSATPYAIRSLSAASADNASTATTAANAGQLGGVAANQFVQTSDSRLSDSRPPAAGSANYIQNSTTARAGSNFNISGDGTAGGKLSANVVNASTQYNLNGNRAFSITGGGGGFANTNTWEESSAQELNWGRQNKNRQRTSPKWVIRPMRRSERSDSLSTIRFSPSLGESLCPVVW